MIGQQCPQCVHYKSVLKCRAFPTGIPAHIATGKHDHRKPYKGDQGIRYEPRKA